MSLQVPPGLAALSARLSDIGFERTRRALAALALSMFFSLYLLMSLNAPEGFGRVFVALSLCYGVAFVAVVAEWFWGRWFASGLAWSGVMIAIAALVMIGWNPALAIFGGMHLIVILSLMGKKMAARYDLQEAWRQKYKMDDFGVARLQKTVTRSAASLPSLILWALAPKEGEGMAIVALAALGLGVVGLRALVHLRSWGVLALGAAGALVLAGGKVGALHSDFVCGTFLRHDGIYALYSHESIYNLCVLAGPTLAFVLLAAAVLPFTGAIARYLRRPA
jgi:hypothetical protein